MCSNQRVSAWEATHPGKAGTLAGQNPTCDVQNCPGRRGLGEDVKIYSSVSKPGNQSRRLAPQSRKHSSLVSGIFISCT